MHYYKFNISDWHLATSHLSLEEEAVYFKLVNFYYDTEKPIPLETKSVIRRLRLGNYTAMVDSVLDEFFTKQDDGWHHQRCDDEIQKYHHKAEVNQKVGKLGGRPKKINDLEPNPKLTQSVSKINPQKTLTTNQEPLTTNHKPLNTIQAPEGVSVEVWNDFVLQRKKSRAVVSDNVIKSIAKEAQKAGWSLEQALAECAARGWRGFKAEWVKEIKKPDVINVLTRGLISGGSNVRLLGE
jgi:uncharacterized protein YdaU (DUF1376 family)